MFMTEFWRQCNSALVLCIAASGVVQYGLDSTGLYTPPSSAALNVGAVNIERNDKRVPLPYRTQKLIQKVQTLRTWTMV
jgi:hypothetical protein